MYQYKEKTQIPFQIIPDDLNADELLFFDIETTGLSPSSSVLTIIGMIYRDGGVWYLEQLFAETELQETELLQAFCAVCSSKKQLVHFNGSRFDVPYLEKKCSQNDIDPIFSQMKQIDLYLRYKPLKSILHLPDTKQRSFESFLEIPRKDKLTSAEMITVYHKYVLNNHREDLDLLLTHNREDVLGLVKLLVLEPYLLLANGSFEIINYTFSRPSSRRFEFCATLLLSRTLLKPVSFLLPDEGYLTAEGGTCRILIYGYFGYLKHFLENYQKYYYLPAEDIAIHKSVGNFVDPSHREQAKASNCYTKKKGYFLPQKSIFYTPTFRKDYRDPVIYFECTDKFGNDPTMMNAYLQDFFFGKSFRE